MAFSQAATAAEEGDQSDHDEDLGSESSWDPSEDNPEEVIPDLKKYQMNAGPQTLYRKKVVKISKTFGTRNDSNGNDDDEEVKGLESESE
jgi:hypothetical protein